MIDLPPLTYLSADSMSEGVGASQVLPYVEALSRQGMTVRLHSLEKGQPSPEIADRLDAAGVRWHPHPWGGWGPTAGLARLVRGATYLCDAELVHARSDIPAGSALLARRPAWIWDMRGFWADERMEMGLLRPGSPQERLMRSIERQSAKKAAGIVTLTAAAIDELERRHGPSIRRKSRVITTCVELNRFPVSPMPPPEPLNLLLAGTLSRRYDVPLMLRLIDELRRRRGTQLTALIPGPSPWDGALQDAGVPIQRAATVDMPGHLRASHAGLSVLRPGGGVAMKASMPTKVGEFLASGRPMVVNAGLGDLDQLLTDHECGVILRDDTPESVVAGADSIERLLADRDTPARCRKLAEDNFRLETAVDDLVEVYGHAL
jgi:glycosyltransferase involved in cell wall biosynthesis